MNLILALGRGCLLAKLDIKSAFRIVPVHPADRYLLGMRWCDQLYVDTVLSFGLRSAPKIFNALADALEWVLRDHGIRFVRHYLDDFMLMGPPASSECGQAIEMTNSICELLGVPLAPDKCEGPATILTYLGIEFNTSTLHLRLPDDKIQSITELLSSWEHKQECTKKQLESLIGVLQHAASVIKPGRAFLRYLIQLSSTVRNPYRPVRVNAAIRSDIHWWQLFLRSWNGLSMMSLHGPQHYSAMVTSDALGSWGCGAYHDAQWFQLQWQGTQPGSIAAKELVPILIAAAIWGRQWFGKAVLFRCDNQAVVAVLKSRYSRDADLMHLLRCLFFFEAHFGFNAAAVHLPGASNEHVDALSRDRLSAFLLSNPQANPTPTPIPRELTALLMGAEKPNWTSATWKTLFSSILGKV